jgi:hypothetical protein
MDEAGVRAALKHHFDLSSARQEDVAREVYLDDAVLEFPQSGERFDGVENFRELRRQYPATKVEFDVRRVRVEATSGSWSCGSATTAVPVVGRPAPSTRRRAKSRPAGAHAAGMDPRTAVHETTAPSRCAAIPSSRRRSPHRY